MGAVCPCSRDIVPKQPATTMNECFAREQSTDMNPLLRTTYTVNLRSEQSLVRIVGPLACYYSLVSEMTPEAGHKVFLAEYIRTKQRCVVKFIKKEGSCRERKSTIFRTLMRLDHPHVLKTYEVCQDNEYVYAVWEALECADLCRFLAVNAFMTQAMAATTMYEVLSALAHSHSLGILHRRLSFSSILLAAPPGDDSIRVKVAGFELFDADCPKIQHFEAPECADEQYSEKSDVWSCGVMLYILLCGEEPFDYSETTASKPTAKFDGVTFSPDLWDEVDREATSLINSMLSRRPQSRPTALQCLSHPWFKKHFQVLPLSSRRVRKSLNAMHSQGKVSSITAALMQFIVTRVMPGSEIAKAGEVFTALDRNGDGIITREELLRCLPSHFRSAEAQARVETIIAKTDLNCDELISYSEFLLRAFDEKQLLSKENLKLAFCTLDKDASGAISVQELKMFFRLNGNPGSLEQWRELIAGIDSTGSGEIGFEDFERLMERAYKGS